MAARALPVSLIAASALLLATATAVGASAAGAPTDTRTSITVDCEVGEGSNDNQVILPGETLTVTLLNCDGWDVIDDDAGTTLFDQSGNQSNDWVVVGSPATFTVTGEADIYVLEPIDGEYDIDIDVYVADPAATPSGSLNLTTRLTMPVEIPDFEINVPVSPASTVASSSGEGAVDESSDDKSLEFTPAADLGGLSDCSMEDGYHPYQTLPISISASGDFTFRVIDVTPVDEDLQWGQPYLPSQDFFLAVYTTFDPENPEANLVSCNDDRDEDRISIVNGGITYISDDQAPEFIASLTPGEYTLVLTTYRSTSSAEWARGEFSPWSGVSDTTWDPQPMTALFELWGPAGSIELGGEEQLAETGTETAVVGAAISLGLASLLAGVGLIAARRRHAAS